MFVWVITLSIIRIHLNNLSYIWDVHVLAWEGCVDDPTSIRYKVNLYCITGYKSYLTSWFCSVELDLKVYFLRWYQRSRTWESLFWTYSLSTWLWFNLRLLEVHHFLWLSGLSKVHPTCSSTFILFIDVVCWGSHHCRSCNCHQWWNFFYITILLYLGKTRFLSLPIWDLSLFLESTRNTFNNVSLYKTSFVFSFFFSKIFSLNFLDLF